MTSQQDRPSHGERRDFLKSVALGAAAFGIGAAGPEMLSPSVGRAQAAAGKTLKMAFIQFMPHTVPAAWSKGIEDVLSKQGNIDYQLLDGQAKVEVQISLMDTQINDGANVIFLQPVDSVAIGPSIAKAKRAGIPVITLNIDAVEDHAAHVEMSHYAGAMDVAKTMGEAMEGKGKVAIINAPPGIIIRDQRTNGFVDGLKKYYPAIQIAADQPRIGTERKLRTSSQPFLPPIPTFLASSASTIRWRSALWMWPNRRACSASWSSSAMTAKKTRSNPSKRGS